MSNVVRMKAFRSRDTVGELRALLVSAMKGDVAGFTFGVEMADGTQRTGFTGKFRGNPAEAAKMAYHLAQLLRPIEVEEDAPKCRHTATACTHRG